MEQSSASASLMDLPFAFCPDIILNPFLISAFNPLVFLQNSMNFEKLDLILQEKSKLFQQQGLQKL